MNLFRKRFVIALAAVGAVGAIAAVATAASLALFYDPVAPQSVHFVTGDVTLNHTVTANCGYQHITPGYSTHGYPAGLGDQSGQACTVDIMYTGSLDAFLALDVQVQTAAGNSTIACNGGDASGVMSCEPMYNPNPTDGAGKGLEVYVLANGDSYNGGIHNGPTQNGPTQAFGIGNDQTISQPGTVGVDLKYSQNSATGTTAACSSSTGQDCPVLGGFKFLESFSVYVYWPLSTTGNQNVYQNSSATVTLTEHAVQAADNPLFQCPAINDSQGLFGGANYFAPDQPQEGWGAGFSAGQTDGSPAVGKCPAIDPVTNGTDWTSTSSGATLYPFYHPNNSTPTTPAP